MKRSLSIFSIAHSDSAVEESKLEIPSLQILVFSEILSQNSSCLCFQPDKEIMASPSQTPTWKTFEIICLEVSFAINYISRQRSHTKSIFEERKTLQKEDVRIFSKIKQ